MRRLGLTSVLVVVASVFLTSTARAQKPGPLCQTGCGDNPPWVVWVAPPGATVYTPTPYVEIHFCKNSFPLDPTNYQVKLNGVDRTSALANWTWGDPGGLCGGTASDNAYVSSSSVTFSVGANTLYANVCDTEDPKCGSNSRTITLAAAGAPTIVTHNLNSDNQDRGLCLTVGAGQAAGLSCGDLFVAHGMPAYRTMGRDRSLTLFYSSAMAAPRPAVAAWVTEPSTIQTPTAVWARLQINNFTKDSAMFASFGPATRQVVLAYDPQNDSSGIYPFTFLVRNQYAGGPYDATVSGEILFVNRSSSEFGAGWWLEGVERLVTTCTFCGTRMVWIGGDGSAAVYNQVNSTTWARASGAYRDTIVLAGGQYTRRLRHGTTVTFDGSGHHIQTSNKAHPGQVTRFTWSTGSPSRLTTIQVPPDTIHAYYSLVWNGSTHLLDSIIDPAGRSLRATMSSGTLTQLRDADARTTGFGYDGSGRLTARTTPRNYTTSYAYANGLRVTRVAIPLNPAVSDSARDSSRTSLEWWDQKGLAIGSPGGTLTAVDSASVYTKVHGPRTNVADDATFWVDRWGAPLRIVGAVGDTTVLTRSPTTGLVSMVRNAIGDSITATYNVRGNDSTVTDQTHEGGGSVQAVTTSYLYGDAQVPDSPTLIRTPVDTTTIQYNDSLGMPSLVTAQGGARAGYVFDLANGLLTSVIDYGVSLVDTTNWASYSSDLTRAFAYDLAGNDTAMTAPSGLRTRHVRDLPYRRVTQSFDLASHETDYAYDVMNRDTAVTVMDGDAFTTRYRYSADGAIDTILDPRKVARAWFYDAAGRDTALVDDRSSVEHRYFNAAGLLDSLRTRDTTVIRHFYDAGGRDTAIIYPAFLNRGYPQQGDVTVRGDTIVRTYDPLGRTLTAHRSVGDVVTTYNREGTVRSERQIQRSGSGQVLLDDTLRYWMDKGDRRVGFYNSVDSLAYSYGTDGRMATLAVNWSTGQAPDTFRFGWDALGRRGSVVYVRPHTTVSYGYDTDGRLRQVNAQGGAAYLNQLLRLQSVTPDGMPLKVRHWQGSPLGELPEEDFTYNARHFVASDLHWLYDYDSSGNRSAQRDPTTGRLAITYTNWITTVGGDTLYTNRVSEQKDSLNHLMRAFYPDANGWRRFDGPEAASGDWRIYYYDAVGELVGQEEQQYPNWTGSSSLFTYDALGRRVLGGPGISWLAYDGNNVVRNGSIWRYAQGPDVDDPLVGIYHQAPNYIRYYYMTYGEGRLLAFVDESGNLDPYSTAYSQWGGNQAGAVSSSMSMDNLSRASAPSVPTVSFFRNRSYDQATGQWMQEDPSGVAGGANLFMFSGNNPATFTDPFGLCPDSLQSDEKKCRDADNAAAASADSGNALQRAAEKVTPDSFVPFASCVGKYTNSPLGVGTLANFAASTAVGSKARVAGASVGYTSWQRLLGRAIDAARGAGEGFEVAGRLLGRVAFAFTGAEGGYDLGIIAQCRRGWIQ